MHAAKLYKRILILFPVAIIPAVVLWKCRRCYTNINM